MRTILFSILLVSLSSAIGAREIYVKDGLGNSGYDVVSYFTDGKAIRGNPFYESKYLGVTWRFSSEANKKLFDANPEKYMPQYGGYCAWAIAEKDELYPTDPKAFAIKNGKLYLNYDEDVQSDWLEDAERFIQKADKNWKHHQ